MLNFSTPVRLAVLGAALVCASAQANTTHASFTDVEGSLSFDGWNELNRNRSTGALTEEELVAGTTANVAGSGDAVLTRVAGTHYPAGFGLYGAGDADGDALLTFTDGTLAAGATTLVFQGIINNFSGVDHTLLLSFNGGTQALAADSISSVLTGGINDYFTYTWDLSALDMPLTSYSLALGIGFSQMLAFQVDQVAAVPEPSTYAMLLAGLGAVGVVARRRQAQR